MTVVDTISLIIFSIFIIIICSIGLYSHISDSKNLPCRPQKVTYENEINRVKIFRCPRCGKSANYGLACCDNCERNFKWKRSDYLWSQNRHER